MSEYPIILIPTQIKQVKSAQPPVPPFIGTQPQQPGAEPQKVSATIIAVEATVTTVPSVVIVSKGGTVPGLLLLLASAGAIAAHIWHQIKTFPQRRQKHNNEVANYSRNFESYRQRERQHEEEVRVILSPERVAEFRYRLLLEILRQTTPHDGDRSNATIGWSEVEFGDATVDTV